MSITEGLESLGKSAANSWQAAQVIVEGAHVPVVSIFEAQVPSAAQVLTATEWYRQQCAAERPGEPQD